MQGLPVVQAPGEGEALCAALNQQGLVHSCATLDGDVLLFGAERVYHTLKLQVREPALMTPQVHACAMAGLSPASKHVLG